MNVQIRPYAPSDHKQVAALYKQSHLYGGQFDENRDSEKRLQKRVAADPDAILVVEQAGKIVGTVSLIEDGRVAWLFRFCVIESEDQTAIAQALFEAAAAALKRKGHQQVLVYTPVGNIQLYDRYKTLGFTKGGDYTCFWKDI